jgi:hypothetical protein
MENTQNSMQPSLLAGMAPRFGSGFLKDHAGKILTDSKIAIVELVANSWDAGADLVEITWPDDYGEEIVIKDNGTGMTYDEFINRWIELSYNRRDEQGPDVVFPTGNQRSSRQAFGRNGKGRHGMFCFSDIYHVMTIKDGEQNLFRVTRSASLNSPFKIEELGRQPSKGHGLTLSSKMESGQLSISDLTELIGSKFVADPSFRIKVNGEYVELTDLENVSETYDLHVNGLGSVKIRHFDSRKTGRTSKQHGIAWWVNHRLVGEASWRGFDDNPYLDARKAEAKRHTFVVEADILESSVETDWDVFRDTPEFRKVSSVVKDFILTKLQELFSDVQKFRKIEAISSNRSNVKELTPGSRKMLGTFVEEVQRLSPTITQRDLNATVEVLAKLEKSRSQYTLLEQLSKLNPDDLDGLSELLSQWSISEAKLVLDELGKRLRLIETLEKSVEDPLSDELHQIQPLFEVGLWIFGPEFESIEFIANRTLSSVIQNFLHDKGVQLSTPKRRPDIVILPDSRLSIYSSDAFDERSEVSGFSKILIIELKKGGFTLTTNERRQCEDYANELRKSGKVGKTTKIIGFILGATIQQDAQEESTIGHTTIYPRTYSVVLRQAHARTFNLLEKMKQIREEKGLADEDFDSDVEKVISQEQQFELTSMQNEGI